MSSKKKFDDMSAFAISAKWKLLAPVIDADKLVNEGMTDAKSTNCAAERR